MAKYLKDPFIISLILVIAVGSGIAFFRYQPFKKEIDPFLKGKVELITKIEISSQEEKTILKKENENWLVETENNQKANQQLVERLIKKLEQLKNKQLVSENPNNHQKYGVDQQSAIKLTVKNKDQSLLELYIGNVGPSYNNHYIRQKDSNEVYLSNLALKSILMPNSGWLKKDEDQEENSAI